jgi:hypothetical protein
MDIKYEVMDFACIFAWVRRQDGTFLVDPSAADTFKEHYPAAVEVKK